MNKWRRTISRCRLVLTRLCRNELLHRIAKPILCSNSGIIAPGLPSSAFAAINCSTASPLYAAIQSGVSPASVVSFAVRLG